MRLIDADELIKQIEADAEHIEEPLAKMFLYANISDIKHAPTIAQPERKKGKWIEAYDPFNRISGRCSVCGWEAHLYEDDVVGMNYCPNCGADMRGEQDE